MIHNYPVNKALFNKLVNYIFNEQHDKCETDSKYLVGLKDGVLNTRHLINVQQYKGQS